MSENKLQIREATIADYVDIIYMVFEYIKEFEKRELTNMEADSVRLVIFHGLRTGSETILIAEKKSRKGKKHFVGYGLFDLRPNIYSDLVAWGHQLYIKPQFRNKDVADLILAEAEKLSVEAGAKEFYIDTPMPEFFKDKGYSKEIYAVIRKKLKEGE